MKTNHILIIGLTDAVALSKKTQQSVVVLVPGWKDTTRMITPLFNYLVAKGFPAVMCSPQPSDGSLTIPEMAALIKPTCVELVEQTQRPLKLVGFSMGGLIVRSYLQEFDGAKNCSHLVTVSTPHMGVLTALVTKKPGLQQMKPNDPWLQHLNATFSEILCPRPAPHRSGSADAGISQTVNLSSKTDGRSTQIKVTSIWSPFDATIIPPSSSFLAMVENVTILSPVHALIMRDKRVHRAVEKALSE